MVCRYHAACIGGSPANSTIGTLGAPAWHRASDGSYYYGVFTGGMPDLDHGNPLVFQEMVAIARYWLDQGFDGLRIDAIQHVVEGADGAIANAPENFDWVQRFGAAVRAEHPGAFLLGETWTNTPTIASYHRDADLDMSVDYPLFSALTNAIQGRNASNLRLQLTNNANLLPAGAWIASFVSNHDQLRPATVLSPLRRNPAREALLGRLLLALPGIPFLYYGEEIGMPNGPGLDDRQKRTPMRWSASESGGFSRVEPWFPPSTLDPAVSVEAQRADPDSTFHAYREAIALRAAHPALAHGPAEVLPTRGGLLALWRRAPDPGGADVLLLANLAASNLTVDLAALGVDGRLIALSDRSGPAGEIEGTLVLPGNSLTLLTPAP
jgi:glycosidase